MSGAHPGGIQPEHSPHTALRSVELSLPLFTPLWFSLSLPCSGSTLQTFLELFPFSSPDQSSLCESSGLSVDSASPLRLQNTRQLLVAFTSAYFFPPEIPESEPSQSYSAPTALPSCFSLFVGVCCGTPALHRGTGIAPEGQPRSSLQAFHAHFPNFSF